MKRVFLLSIALCAVFTISAQNTVTVETDADDIVRLWDNSTAKYSNDMSKDELLKKKTKLYNTSSAELYIFTPPKEKATGYCMVIYPGGGYTHLSIPLSFPVWCRNNGITAVVVKYRLPNTGHADAMLEDAIGAIEYMRDNAEKYNLDPKKVGVYGNSAGGHLAAWVSNILEDEKKPCFSILVYGAMVRDGMFNRHSTNILLGGKDVSASMAERYCTPNLVTETTPPTLLLLSDNDLVVRSITSTAYYKALKRYGVPASMHIYPTGGHGWSGKTKWEYREQWLGAVKDWIENLEEYRNRTKNK